MPFTAGPVDFETALKAGTLVCYRDSAAATISVKRLTGTLSLSVDGKVDASTSGDMITQKTLAHLPLLLHGSPRRVCIIGLGSGVTLASALLHPISSVDVVEISPEVVDASRLFAVANSRALEDPRAHLILGDGRTHLMLADQQSSVWAVQPVVGRRGSTLYSRISPGLRSAWRLGHPLPMGPHVNITDHDLR